MTEIENALYQIAQQPPEMQQLFIDKLCPVLAENELQALQIGIAYFRLLLNDELRDSMKNALAKQLYSNFNQSV